MTNSITKILEEMRAYDGTWNVPIVWADRLEALMREPVAWIECKTAGVYTVSLTKDGVNYQPLFTAPPDTQAIADAAREECALIVLSNTQHPYQPYSIAKQIRSRIGKPVEVGK